METRLPIPRQQIVVIEEDADLGHVVALALEHHGHPVRVFRALADAWEATQAVPALVVLDLGPATRHDCYALAALERHQLLGAAPVVLLAWECPIADAPPPGNGPRICLSKPFDARALDGAVAAILAPAAAPLASSPSSMGVTALESTGSDAEPAPAPSMWPIVTAAAGFAAVVGFMIHPIFILVGLGIMIAAILWWALEPAQPSVLVSSGETAPVAPRQ